MHSQACFLKLAGPQLVQMFIGDGAKLVRDAFALAKEKSKPGLPLDRHILFTKLTLVPNSAGSGNNGAIIFIDELDAVGTKRFDSEVSGDREVIIPVQISVSCHTCILRPSLKHKTYLC